MAGLGENCCGGGSGFATGDHKVLVDGADTTPDFLSPKLAAGAGITLAVLNPGANEQVQINATGSAGVENLIRYAIGTAATQDSVTQIPAAAIITGAWLDVQTPYTAGTTISIGQPGSLTRFQTATDNNPLAAAIYTVDQDTTSVGLAVVRATIAGGPVAGAGFVLVWYATPNP